jgi:hypothetical protein
VTLETYEQAAGRKRISKENVQAFLRGQELLKSPRPRHPWLRRICLPSVGERKAGLSSHGTRRNKSLKLTPQVHL